MHEASSWGSLSEVKNILVMVSTKPSILKYTKED